ncbi:MAG: hypothetical protein ACKO13_10105, partial [Cytophagales bacterium]
MKYHYVLILAMLVTACSKGYKPTDHLTGKEQDEFVWKIIRYIAKPPEVSNLSKPERFYKGYDPYYQEQQARHRLDAYFIKDDVHYFLISRQAPSIVVKRVATGGRLKLDAKGNLLEYEEVFRTWKMTEEMLQKKSMKLFDLMVKGEPLEKYRTKYTFPDE